MAILSDPVATRQAKLKICFHSLCRRHVVSLLYCGNLLWQSCLTLLLPNQSSTAHFQTLREWENCTFSSTSRNAKPHIFTYFAIMRPPSPTVAGTDPPPIRLRPIHVLPKQQRPLRSLLHYAASILSLCRRTPLRHKQIFGTIPTEPLDGL